MVGIQRLWDSRAEAAAAPPIANAPKARLARLAVDTSGWCAPSPLSDNRALS